MSKYIFLAVILISLNSLIGNAKASQKPVASREVTDFLLYGLGENHLPGNLILEIGVDPKHNRTRGMKITGREVDTTVNAITVRRIMVNVNKDLYVSKDYMQVSMSTKIKGVMSFENISLPSEDVLEALPNGYHAVNDNYGNPYEIAYQDGVLIRTQTRTGFQNDGEAFSDKKVMKVHINPLLTEIEKVEYLVTRTNARGSKVITDVVSNGRFVPVKDSVSWGPGYNTIPRGYYTPISEFVILTR